MATTDAPSAVTFCPADNLSSVQIATLVAIGATLWFLAALLIRAIEPLGALEGSGVPILYALTIPGTYPFIVLTRRVVRLAREQVVYGIALATGTATLLDGLALAFFPALYGANTAGAGAAILWGAGVGLMLAAMMARRR